MKRFYLCFLQLAFAANCQSVHGVIVSNYTSATNDRFADDGSFVGAGLDFSGVGRSADGRWATLIGENYFLTANHFPANGTIEFRAGNNFSAPVFQYEVAGSFAVAGTDIRIGYFNENVDPSIERYTYNNNDANALSDLGITGTTLYTSGDRVAGAPGTLLDHVVATNQAESWFEEGTNTIEAPNPGGTPNLFLDNATFDQIVTFRNLVDDDANTVENFESQLQAGDSGSPLFSNQSGSLRIEGLAWAIVTPGLSGDFESSPGLPVAEQRQATLYSYLGSYDPGIQATILNVPAVIPEPSTTVLIGLGLLSSLSRHKRKS